MDHPKTTSPGRRRLAASVVAACLLITPAVTACSFNPIESAIEKATGGNVDIGGTSIPDDFPAEVPLIDGEVVSAFGVGTPPDKVWTVTMKVADASALDTIKADLEGAGFTSEMDEAAVAGVTGGMYTSDKYGVLVVVAEDGDSGWIANYTVTPAAQ